MDWWFLLLFLCTAPLWFPYALMLIVMAFAAVMVIVCFIIAIIDAALTDVVERFRSRR